MLSIPGTEALSPAVKYLIAFAIIFLLLALFALVLRRLTGGRLSIPGNDRRTRQPRLGIVDVYDLDRQRQLILLRRDNVEHLLLIGGPNDVIVETNIVRTPGARLPPSVIEQNDRPETLIDRSVEASRPMVEPSQRQEPVVARLGTIEAPRVNAEQTVRAPMPEPMLKPDVVAMTPAPQTMPRPAPQPVREPPPQPLREPPPPAPPPQRAAPFKPPPPREAAPPPPPEPVVRAVPEPPRQPAQPPARAGEPGVSDAAVLSNMARQLEDALKRPLSGGKAASPAPPPNGPASPADERLRGTPAAPARMPPQPAPMPAPPPAFPPFQSTGLSEPPDVLAQRSRPAPVSRMRPEPEPAPKPASPPQQPAAPGGAEQADPFSVEEIEAEFARLLGRPVDRSDRPH